MVADHLRSAWRLRRLPRGAWAGPDIVVPQKGEPDGFDYVPTQEVVVQVTKVLKGDAKVGDLLTLSQTGGDLQTPSQAKVQRPTFVLHDDPFYAAGEQYLLLLDPRPQTPGQFVTISPDGRYLVQQDGTLKAMDPARPAAREVHGKTLAAMEQMLLTPAQK